MLLSDEHFSLVDDLFSDVEPQLFAIDHLLCKAASTYSYRFEREFRKPLCMLEVEEHAGSWLLAYLSNRYYLCMKQSAVESFVHDAARHYNVMEMEELYSKYPDVEMSYLLNTRLDWESLEELCEAVSFAKQNLASGGIATFTLPTYLLDGEVFIHWRSSAGDLPIKDVLRSIRFFNRKEYSSVQLSDLKPNFKSFADSFFKRHKSYFGKRSRGMLASRLREADFRASLESNQSATLMTFRSVL